METAERCKRQSEGQLLTLTRTVHTYSQMEQRYTIKGVFLDQLARECEAIGDPSTYRWTVTVVGWDGEVHRRELYDETYGGRDPACSVAISWLKRIRYVQVKPPPRSDGWSNLHDRPTILGVYGLDFRHRFKLPRHPTLYIHGFDGQRAIMDRSPRRHGLFPALRDVCRAKAEYHVRGDLPKSLSVEDSFEPGEFEEEVGRHTDMMLRIAWPRLKRFGLKYCGLYEWPHADYLTPGTYD